jgi:alkylation response protein AidB-like acyl-CoA dehydrogenase
VLGPDALAGPWARDRAYSRAMTIAGGTTQVNKNIVAQRLLGLPRS